MPVMKTVISGVEVDLLFARVNLPEAGDSLDIEKDEILRGVDDASQRSLNGESDGQASADNSRSPSHGYDSQPRSRRCNLPYSFEDNKIMGKASRYLLQRAGFPGRRSMGASYRSNMSTVSCRCTSNYCWQVFPYLLPMELAPACAVEED